MRKSVLVTALVAFAIPAAAQRVDVADGDWSEFPALEKSQIVNLGPRGMANIDGLVAAGKCDKIGNKRRIRMEIPFIAQFAKNGDVEHVMLQRINCPEVESIAASAAYHAAKEGRVKPGNSNPAGWYRGVVSYILG
jgi:hypothetical protein